MWVYFGKSFSKCTGGPFCLEVEIRREESVLTIGYLFSFDFMAGQVDDRYPVYANVNTRFQLWVEPAERKVAKTEQQVKDE